MRIFYSTGVAPAAQRTSLLRIQIFLFGSFLGLVVCEKHKVSSHVKKHKYSYVLWYIGGDKNQQSSNQVNGYLFYNCFCFSQNCFQNTVQSAYMQLFFFSSFLFFFFFFSLFLLYFYFTFMYFCFYLKFRIIESRHSCFVCMEGLYKNVVLKINLSFSKLYFINQKVKVNKFEK